MAGSDEQVTPEQLQAGGQVAGAAVEAAQGEQNPAAARTAAARAARRRAQEVNIKLSEDDAKVLASAVVDEIESRGGFDAPPEHVAAPPPPPAAQSPEPAGQQHAEPAKPRTFAERFRGRS